MAIRDAMAQLCSAFEAAKIRFAIGGSWASTAFGEPRFTNDMDILADLTPANLDRLLDGVPPDFLVDRPEARLSLRLGRSFNMIYIPMAFKFDLFPASAFLLGEAELRRAVRLEMPELSDLPLPFVTPEDILLAKLNWFRAGGEVSEVQWRDILGIVRSRRESLDLEYLKAGAATLELPDLLERALLL